MAKKHRSPNYPSVSLPKAIQICERIWSNDKRTALSREAVASAAGYSSLSGSSRACLSALQKYGLLEKVGAGLRLSQVAIQAIRGDEEDKRAALRQCAENVPIFAELLETHAESSRDSLLSHLIVNLGFSQGGAENACEAFMETKALVCEGSDSNMSEAPHTQGSQMNATALTPVSPLSLEPLGSLGAGPFISFPLGSDNRVEVRLQKRISRKDFDRLKKLIELSEESLIEDEPED